MSQLSEQGQDTESGGSKLNGVSDVSGAQSQTPQPIAVEPEVKPSFSMKYVLLTLVVSIITGVAGYSLKFVFERPPKRVLSLKEDKTKNLLDLDEKARKEIDASYKLKKRPDETVRSYFQYSVTIRNSGDEGIEGLKIFVDATGQGLKIIKPTFLTPSNLIVKQIPESSDNKDQWEISVLNRGQSVTLSYLAYSTEYLPDVSFTVTVPKKDWELVPEGEIEPTRTSFFNKPVSQMTGLDLIYLSSLLLAAGFYIFFGFRFFLNRTFLRRPR